MTEPDGPVDLRLVPSAAVCWAVTLTGLLAGWRPVAVVGVGLVAAGTVTAVAAYRSTVPLRRTVAAALIAATLLGAGFAAATALRVHAATEHPLAGAAARGAAATLTVVVDDDPKPLRASGFGGPRQLLVRTSLREVHDGDRTVRAGGSILVFAQGDRWENLLPGQQVTVRGKLAVPGRRDLTVAVLRAAGPPSAVQPPPVHQRWAGTVRHRLAAAAAAALPPDQAGLLPGLVVGDVSALPQEVKDQFTAAGLTHLTAVSGANVTLVLGAVLLLVRGAGIGPRTGAVLAGVALVAFVIVARPSPSVLRAAVMGAVALLALVVGRRKQAMPALAASVIVLLAVVPSLAVDFGFALSVAATAGLIVVAPILVEKMRSWGWPRWLAEACAVAVAAFVVTAPIVAAMSGTVSVVSIAANLLVAPVVAPITVIGAVAAIPAMLWLPAATLLVRAAGPPLWWLLEVADRAAAVPGATVTIAGGLAGAVIVGVALVVTVVAVRYHWSRRLLAALVVGVAVVWVPTRIQTPGWPADGWAFVACDVGQGDGLVLATGDGRAVVVDAGPEPGPVDRCLRELGIDEIALLIVTHLHADHYGGLDGALSGRAVAGVAIGPSDLPAGGMRFVSGAADRAGVPVVRLTPGHDVTFGEIRLEILGPLVPTPRTAKAADDAANDTSLVIRAHTRAGTILLTGDVEEAGQRALMRSGVTLRADVLKLPHHGSRTTAPEFVEAVRPRLVVVSVGAGNPFGHPNRGILDRATALGAVVARTDLQGDVAVTRTGAGALAVVGRSHGTIVR